jgi:hypothetical protein
VKSQSVVMIEVTGYHQEEPGDLLPRIKDDDGLVGEMMRWEHSQKIRPVHAPHSGGGARLAYFEPEDAEKVLAWLKEHNKR